MHLLIKTLLASGILFVGGYGTYKVIDTPKSIEQTQDRDLPDTPGVDQSTDNPDQVAIRSGSNGNSDVSLSSGNLSGQNLLSSQPKTTDIKQATMENQRSDNSKQNTTNKEKNNDSGSANISNASLTGEITKK